MIGFIDVTKCYPSPDGVRLVLNDVSLLIPVGERVAILARSGAGKSTVIRLLAGLEAADGGEVVRDANTSLPLGFAGALHRDLAGDVNVRLIAQLHAADPDEISLFCREFSELGEDYFRPLSSYSAGMRARLGFALSMAMRADMYLADEVVGVGDNAFRAKCEVALEQRLDTAGLVLLTRNPRLARRFCTQHGVLHDGRIVMCGTHDDATRLFEDALGASDDLRDDHVN